MKVTIRSDNPVTSEQVKGVIDKLNEDYSDLGLVVKNMTLYVRFQDKTGKTVEPQIDGCDIQREFNFRHTVSKRKE